MCVGRAVGVLLYRNRNRNRSTGFRSNESLVYGTSWLRGRFSPVPLTGLSQLQQFQAPRSPKSLLLACPGTRQVAGTNAAATPLATHATHPLNAVARNVPQVTLYAGPQCASGLDSAQQDSGRTASWWQSSTPSLDRRGAAQASGLSSAEATHHSRRCRCRQRRRRLPPRAGTVTAGGGFWHAPRAPPPPLPLVETLMSRPRRRRCYIAASEIGVDSHRQGLICGSTRMAMLVMLTRSYEPSGPRQLLGSCACAARSCASKSQSTYLDL